MSRPLKVLMSFVVALILLSSGFIGGYAVSNSHSIALPTGLDLAGGSSSTESTTSVELSKRILEVQTILDGNALAPSNIDSATAGALGGLLSANGDRWSAYLPPVDAAASQEEMNGEFGGIGVVLADDDAGVVSVREVYENTPASKADVRIGDVFVSIDGKKQDKWTADEVSGLVRGPKGTDVEIVFRRPSKPGATDGDLITKKIVRDTIVVKNVTSEVVDGVGYIYMSQFNARSTQDIEAALKKMDAAGVSGYVLDLRYNPGGLLDQAVGVASLFVDSGTIVKVESRDGSIEELKAKRIKMTDKPLVLLVNEHSASASEVLAGALKDFDRATIVGKKTFGKGSVQEVIELSFGGTVKFTSAHYLSPKGTVIDGVGVSPDVDVDGGEVPHFALEHKDDVQLVKAIQTLKSIK